MRKLTQRIIHILDGTPADYGKRQSGQSLVELALITPILIIMLMGLAEIGWFANNYLILLEVSRVGARNGTVLNGELGPTEDDWNWMASVHYDLLADGTPEDNAARQYRNCNTVDDYPGFYNFLVCLMERSLSPLELNRCPISPCDPLVYKDDMVVSVFSVQAIDRNVVNLKPPAPVGSSVPYMTVVGRWPYNANECGYNPLPPGAAAAQEPRDPFDFSTNQDDDEFQPPYNDSTPERQRGFVYLLQHRLFDNPNCYGSEWTIAEVEQLMNLPNFTLTTTQRAQFPSQGMVLVEIFWQHNLLLRNPVFNPVFGALGDNTIISVWAAFPVPAPEPRIRFD